MGDRFNPRIYPTSNPGTSLHTLLQSATTPTLFLVSDGSARRDTGSFGCAIADSTSTVFYQGQGFTKGVAPSSFLAEAYGSLACARFLFRYLQYHPTLPRIWPGQLKIFCDNESLISTLTTFSTSASLYPKDTTRPEEDLLLALYHTLQQLRPLFTISFHHVKGHQAAHLNPSLSWQANLNILCDSLANSALARSHTLYLVPPNPYCPAQLVLGDHTVTGHFRPKISQAFSSPQILVRYLCKRNVWTDNIIASINWRAHHQALNRFPISHRPFLCKFIHRHLPLGDRLRCWTASHPTLCPSCNHPTEDFHHFLTCPHCIPWITSQLSRLAKKLFRLHTAPNLSILLMKILRHIFLDQTLEDLCLDSNEQQLMHMQGAIGWTHVLFGHFATLWDEIQLRHSSRHGPGWSSKVIHSIWQLIQELWFLRNSHLHVSSPALLEPISRRKITTSIQELCEVRASLPPSDQRMFP